MAGTTIASSTTVGVDLSEPSQLPLTITATGTIVATGTANLGDAVYADWGIIGSIGNSGVLTAANDAIYLSSGGTVTNTGKINGSKNGVVLQEGGVVANAGSLGGGIDGVYIVASGALANTGTITGAGNDGVFLHGGGGLSNGGTGNTTASITGAANGVQFGIRAAGTLDNFGTVASTGTASGNGVFTNGRATIVNGSLADASALLSGYFNGVSIGGAGASITNFGRIIGGAQGSPLAAAGFGIYLRSGGTITNGSVSDTKAVISGTSFGIEVAHGAGYVSNFGTIRATSTLGHNGVLLNGGGTIVNGSSIDLSAYIGAVGRSAIYVAGISPGTVNNFGTIVGARDGVAMATGGTVVNGSSADTKATIIGTSNGVYIEGSLPSTVTNSGTISCGGTGRGVFMYLGGSIINGSPTNTAALINGGVYLDLPGTVTNDGQIRSSQKFAAFLSGGTLDNELIVSAASSTGVYLRDSPGLIINGAGATLYGSLLAIYARSTATVVNLGRMISSVYSSVDLLAGGTIVNGSTSDATALIAGNWNGVYLDSLGSVANYGTISGKVFSGIELNAGGTVSNLGSTAVVKGIGQAGVWANGTATIVNAGTITGARGVVIKGSGKGTVVNAGTISNAGGTAGVAIQFGGSAERLVVDPGAVFIGAVIGGSGTNTIELATGANSGSFGGIGTQFSKFRALVVDPGARWSLTGSDSIGTLSDSGTLTIAGSLDVSTSIDPTGAGTLAFGSVATLDVAAVLGSGPRIHFLSDDRLVVDAPADFGTGVGTPGYVGPLLENFAAGDAVDLIGVPSGFIILNFATASGVLTISGTSGPEASLLFQTSSLGSGGFHTDPDGGTGTLLTHS